MGLGEIRLGEMGLDEMGLGEMGQNPSYSTMVLIKYEGRSKSFEPGYFPLYFWVKKCHAL